MSGAAARLSKSRVQSGAQCALRLWYDCFQRELASPVDELAQFLFDRGTRIGLLAQERYPGGVCVEARYDQTQLALRQTQDALSDQSVTALFEPAFVSSDVVARVDVLQRAGDDSWDLIEVKSATRKKDVYLRDLAIQLWILQGAQVRVRRAGLLLLNRSYVYDGKHLDLDALFTFADLTDEALAMHDEVEALVAALQQTLSRAEPPQIVPGNHCAIPYACPYNAHCTKDRASPEHPVSDLPGIRAGKLLELAAMGVAEISEIPDAFRLSPSQARVRKAVIAGVEWVSPGLAGALAEISYPVHHLDFETFMPAVPIYVGTRPFDAVPFQYSIHREGEDGAVEHLEYLFASTSTGTVAPHRELAERLLADLGERGNICVYSSYEQKVINALARRLPDLRDALERLVPRIWDLLPLLRNHYYHPDFHGSFSIKRVLPALVPQLSYENMAIAGGMAAASRYETARALEDEDARNQIYADLRSYCGRDSEAMLELRRALARVPVT